MNERCYPLLCLFEHIFQRSLAQLCLILRQVIVYVHCNAYVFVTQSLLYIFNRKPSFEQTGAVCMAQGMKCERRIELVYDLTCVLYCSRLNETTVLIYVYKIYHVAFAFVDAEFLIVVYQRIFIGVVFLCPYLLFLLRLKKVSRINS